jgi:hypothetical protein
MLRGAGGCCTTGGRQVPGGGSVRGGPAYFGAGLGAGSGAGADGLDCAARGSGRCQYASSSGTEALTFTDGTAQG